MFCISLVPSIKSSKAFLTASLPPMWEIESSNVVFNIGSGLSSRSSSISSMLSKSLSLARYSTAVIFTFIASSNKQARMANTAGSPISNKASMISFLISLSVLSMLAVRKGMAASPSDPKMLTPAFLK